MISCGIQCLTCDYPIHLDTYSGCSHACRYCAANNKTTITKIKPLNNASCLKAFINGHRTLETKWCDWNIPLHWGARSDPFQACETEYKRSLEALQIFKETQYPFIVSTKNPVMLTTEPYLTLISECNAVVQISMACSKYDKLETGAPTYEQRLQAAKILSGKVKRVIIRVQPYMIDCYKDILAEIPKWSEAGVYGIVIEGFVSKKKQKGMVRMGATFRFSLDILAPMYKNIKSECHKYGIRFFCGDDGLICMGDSLTCCGTEGLDTFKPNTYNLSHIAYDDYAESTAAMLEKDTSRPFRTIRQSQAWEKHIKGKSFVDMLGEYENGYALYCDEMRFKYGL